MSASILVAGRKHRANSFHNDNDAEDLMEELNGHMVKRVKDSEMSDTSSEDTAAEESRLEKMAAAMKTIIEVSRSKS